MATVSTSATITITIGDATASPSVSMSSQEGYSVESVQWVPSGSTLYTVNLGGLDYVNFIVVEVDSTDGLPVKAYLNGETTSAIPVEDVMVLTAGSSDADGHARITSVQLKNESSTADSKVKITYSGKRTT